MWRWCGDGGGDGGGGGGGGAAVVWRCCNDRMFVTFYQTPDDGLTDVHVQLKTFLGL